MIEQAKEICSASRVNAVGYWIAGTSPSMTMSTLKQRGDTSVKSATFLTTLTDFSDQGDFTSSLQGDFIQKIEEEVIEVVYGPAIGN